MKKFLLLILAVFSFTLANAQGVKFGIKGGWNYSSVSGGDQDIYIGDADYKNGYHFGIMPNFQFGGMFGFKPELIYSSKGFQLNETFNNEYGGTSDLEIKTNLNYLSLPLLMNINAGPIFFELGPEVAYLLATTGENKVDVKDSNGNKIDKLDSKAEYIIDEENYADFDFGFVAGIGLNLPAGFGLGVRYNGGFMSIYADEKVNGKNVNVKNSTFMVSLNYTFGGHDSE